MLIIFGGLPGSGKTTLAKKLSEILKAVYLRIDTIEHAIQKSQMKVEEVIDAGYLVAYAVAQDNLSLGRVVIADSVNPIEITRKSWIQVATNLGIHFVELEIICSDKLEHKNRVETRIIDIPDFLLPDWEKVEDREYENWNSKHITLDTAGKSVEQSVDELLEKLKPFIQ